MAHKKGQGSTKNGRDSNPQYLGIKLYGARRPRPARSSSASAARRSRPASTSAWARTTPSTASPKAQSSSRAARSTSSRATPRRPSRSTSPTTELSSHQTFKTRCYSRVFCFSDDSLSGFFRSCVPEGSSTRAENAGRRAAVRHRTTDLIRPSHSLNTLPPPHAPPPPAAKSLAAARGRPALPRRSSPWAGWGGPR